ncbi:MAG: hypothetical protein AAFR16_13855, partial [Pseudomonadota bacterium]
TAGSVVTPYVKADGFMNYLAIVQAGALGTGGSVAAKLVQATDDAGAGAKDVEGKAITTLTESGTDDSDQQAMINLNAEELDVDGGFTHFALSITVAGATSDVGGLVLGVDPRRGAPREAGAASVAEIVA